MEMMGTKEASNAWNCKRETIAKWCREGKIEGAEQDEKGHPWRIPINAKCPGKPKDPNISGSVNKP